MPLFMVKQEVFDWVKNGYKTIEVKKGKQMAGEKAVYTCGSQRLRGKIIKKQEDTLKELFRLNDYKKIIPTANSPEEAEAYFKKLYEDTTGIFSAYTIEF
jgi:ASC-1-like (ASCH) protein